MTESEIQLSEFTFLADHKVQNLAVLPGMFLIASLAQKHARCSNISFDSFLTLDDYETAIRLISDDSGAIAFQSKNDDKPFATLQTGPVDDSASSAALLAQTDTKDSGQPLNSTSIYKTLQAQGNDYRDSFQGIQNITRLDQGAVAGWASRLPVEQNQNDQNHWIATLTTLLDSLTHVASFAANNQRTYALKHIDSIQFDATPSVIATATIHLEVVTKNDKQIIANAVISNPEKAEFCRIDGLELQLLQNNNVAAKHQIAVASTFTLDPINDYANFWQQRLDNLVGVSFEEYGQVIQALLGANTSFDNNAVKNVCLIRTQDLLKNANAQTDAHSINSVTKSPSDAVSTENSKLDYLMLPDGRRVASLNKYETLYLYREIFADLSYSKHNVALLDGDTVIDIGANIGFFSIFANSEANDLKIISVEPSPTVLPILAQNLATYAPNAIIEAAGASDKIGTAEFTAYRNSSVFSSFDADSASDEDAITAIVRNQIEETGVSDQSVIDEAIAELMEGRLEFDTFTCPLISVSDIIDKHQLTHINLLKIDAEKSEEQIIAGIREEHWEIIEQIIIEVHLQDNMDPSGIYNILEAQGFTIALEEENLLEASGLINLFAIKPERLERNKKQLIPSAAEELITMLEDAAKAHAARTNTPLEVVFCPPSIDPPFSAGQLRAIETEATYRLENIPNTSAALWSELAARYPISTVLDPVSDELGHIPYTPDWYASTTTAIVRSCMQQQRAPIKVLALDCDNTLWGGVVGEAGVEGIQINEGHQYLHRIVKSAIDSGMLVCLLSKNNEDDVWAVFQGRDDFTLQRSDIVAHRINWEPKASNIQSIAAELNLGLDSFVFLDDAAIECAQMREMHPQVLTMQVPEDSRQFARLLNQYWPLDLGSASNEDAARTKMYQEESKRNDLRSATGSLQNFIASLNLTIEFHPLDEDGLHRAAQMTHRTNQFNLTTIRRTEADLQSLLDEGYDCQTLTVGDKFGDYGVTGLIIAKAMQDTLQIDTFLLSCRILGRGVEHKLVQYLGRLAAEKGCSEIAFHFNETAKNFPAKTFLDALPADVQAKDNKQLYLLNAEAAINFEHTYQDVSVQKKPDDHSNADNKDFGASIDYAFIAENLGTVAQIRNAAENTTAAARPNLNTKYLAPESTLQKTVSTIWCEVLGLDRVGINDNFFELGGTSLKGVQMVAVLQKAIEQRVSVVDIFESSTVADLCNKIESGNATSEAAAAEGRDRGSQRRQARAARPNRRMPNQ